MFAASQSLIQTLLTSAFLFCGTGTASANWFTIKNDTGKPIVVQESVVVNGQVRRGKPTVLLAGETLREFIPGPTSKRIDVYDQQNPAQATWSGTLGCKEENQTFSVGLTGGKVVVGPAVPAKK